MAIGATRSVTRPTLPVPTIAITWYIEQIGQRGGCDREIAQTAKRRQAQVKIGPALLPEGERDHHHARGREHAGGGKLGATLRRCRQAKVAEKA